MASDALPALEISALALVSLAVINDFSAALRALKAGVIALSAVKLNGKAVLCLIKYQPALVGFAGVAAGEAELIALAVKCLLQLLAGDFMASDDLPALEISALALVSLAVINDFPAALRALQPGVLAIPVRKPEVKAVLGLTEHQPGQKGFAGLTAPEAELIALPRNGLLQLIAGDFGAENFLSAFEITGLAPVSRAVLNDSLSAFRARKTQLFLIDLCILSHQFLLSIIHDQCED